jgi:hypothetical protein
MWLLPLLHLVLKLGLVQMLPCPDITAYDKCQFQVQKHLLPWRKTFKLHQDYSKVIPVKNDALTASSSAWQAMLQAYPNFIESKIKQCKVFIDYS